MRPTERYIWSFILIILPLAFYACGSGNDSLPPGSNSEKDKGEAPEVIVNPVTDLKAVETQKANELQLTWEKKRGTITEEPSLIKKGNTYDLLYSANHYESQDYAVGYATSNSSLGPWKKYSGNPILRRDKETTDGLVGTGHKAPFVCKDGSYKYIFHAHASSISIGPRTS